MRQLFLLQVQTQLPEPGEKNSCQRWFHSIGINRILANYYITPLEFSQHHYICISSTTFLKAWKFLKWMRKIALPGCSVLSALFPCRFQDYTAAVHVEAAINASFEILQSS
jgi:hypothetical protein